MKHKLITITSLSQIKEQLEQQGDFREQSDFHDYSPYEVYEHDEDGFNQQACEFLLKYVEKLQR